MVNDRRQDGSQDTASDLRGLDIQANGQSVGIPNAGENEHPSPSPAGRPGLHHWQKSFISRGGIDDRSNVFFAAVEMTRMPMVVTDPNQPDNPIVFANGAFTDLTGYGQSEILGRNCRFLQGPGTDRNAVADLKAAVAEPRAIAIEILNYKRDGTPFWNALFIGPVFDQEGKLLYFFASQMDVTRRRLSEQSLQQAQKMEAIGQLTAGLAHDFNNLLTVIASGVELAKSDAGDNPALGRRLDMVGKAAQRAASLTRQLLAFARKTRLDPKPVDLNRLIQSFSDLLDRTLGALVELRFDLRHRLPTCNVDAPQMEAALLNVLINARDAMPDGGKVVIATDTLRLDGSAEAHHLPLGEYVALSVRDEGQGMSPNILERATEPFFTTKAHDKGTGLGLSMVHGFVRQSGGRLEIESKVGVGTTVRMLFPVTREAVAAPVQPATPSVQGGGETILLVEDSEDVLALAENILADLGYRVLIARNSKEALDVLQKAGDIDLLFTDLVMPGEMNGLLLAEEVRRRLPEVKILLTTGYNEELVAHGPSRRSYDVIGKPYRPVELADRVRMALSREQAGTSYTAVEGADLHHE